MSPLCNCGDGDVGCHRSCSDTSLVLVRAEVTNGSDGVMLLSRRLSRDGIDESCDGKYNEIKSHLSTSPFKYFRGNEYNNFSRCENLIYENCTA